MATCNVLFEQVVEGDVLQWLFTRTIIDNGTLVNISNTDKYNVSGAKNRTLTVNNISSTDEGYYYCQILRNGGLLPDRIPGACLYVYRK